MRPSSRSNRAVSCHPCFSFLLKLSQNGEQLGVRPASKVYIDDSDGMAKRASVLLFCSFMRFALRFCDMADWTYARCETRETQIQTCTTSHGMSQ